MAAGREEMPMILQDFPPLVNMTPEGAFFCVTWGGFGNCQQISADYFSVFTIYSFFV